MSVLFEACSMRARVLAAAGLSCAMAFVPAWQAAVVALAAAAVLFSLQHRSGTHLAASFWSVNLFIALLWVFAPLTTPGHALATVGPLAITGEGVRLAALATFKCNAICLVFASLLGGLTVTEFARGLAGAGLSPKLVTLLVLMSRQVDFLSAEWTRLATAVKLRGFRQDLSLRTYRTVGTMIAALAMRAFARSAVMNEALRLRGFNGLWPRPEPEAFRLADAFLALVACAAALLTYLPVIFSHA